MPPTPPPHEHPTGPSRRKLLTALGVGVPLAVAGCGGGGSNKPQAGAPKETGPREISFFFWGTQIRADITDKVLKLYTQKNPDVTFKQTWQAFAGYYDKLATSAAGGSVADLFQIDDSGLAEYTLRGVALDLKPYVSGKQINVEKFPASLRDAGVVKGKVGGIAAAENTPALYYDKDVLAQYGIAEPQVGYTWDQLVDLGAQLYTKSAGKVRGVMDPAADYKALQVWLRQRGKELYNEEGKFAFSKDDLTQWFQFWADAAARNATPPADMIHVANGGDVTKQLVVTKQAGTSLLWSNQLAALQKATDHKLGIVTYPGEPKGQWPHVSMYWSGYSGTKHPGTVADVINFLVNDVEAGKILGAERGLAPNLDVRQQTASTLNALDQASVNFENSLVDKFGPKPAVPPKGHTQVRTLLVQAAESVQFKKATPAAAADSFYSQATAAIGA
jgi:multiple sugar transport system substrate-binding protein